MRDAAVELGVEILEPPDVNHETFVRQLASLRPDVLVVCDYGQILRPPTLATARLGGINLHGSLLPRWRGAAPVQWAILQGEHETGVSVIHMTPRLDAGPCLVQRSTAIGPAETAPELEGRLAAMGVESVMEALQMLAGWDGESPIGKPQDAAAASRAPRLTKAQGQVDWTRAAATIYDQVRGLKPWPGTFTYLYHADRPPLRLILDSVSLPPEPDLASADVVEEPGLIVQSDSGRLLVATGDGRIAVERLQPAGKRVMSVDEFLRGHPLAAGDRLGRGGP